MPEAFPGEVGDDGARDEAAWDGVWEACKSASDATTSGTLRVLEGSALASAEPLQQEGATLDTLSGSCVCIHARTRSQEGAQKFAGKVEDHNALYHIGEDKACEVC